MRTCKPGSLLALLVSSLVLLTCTSQQNPFDPSKATVTPVLENSAGQKSGSTISDSVGNQVTITLTAYLPSYIDSVKVTVYGVTDTDTVHVFDKSTTWTETQDVSITFRSAGTRTVSIVVFAGGTEKTVTASIIIAGKPTPNRPPVLEVSGVRNILTTQACSLSLSVQDSDAGQTSTIVLVKGPQGATLTGALFTWQPPVGFTGTDSAVFAATDNGTPPMSDTVTVKISVSAVLAVQITTPLAATTSITAGGTTALQVVAGGANLSYQWYFDGTAITGATSGSYSKTWTATDGGTYKVVVSNTAGKDSSTTQVTVSPLITTGLGASTSIAVSSTTALSVTAAGTATLTYQWYYNGTAITGATTSSYSKTWAAGDGGVYKVVVTNSAGSDSSKTTVTINSSITTPLPGTTNVVQGSATPLTIVASGTAPITYQWYYNGTAITGATSASYSKTWGGADGGVYKVVVTNPTGKDSSSTQLTVSPVITSGLAANTPVIQSGSTALSVTASGTAPTYQWYFNGAAISGATSSSYSKTWTATDGGTYKVVATNAGGKDSSTTQVTVSPLITTGLGASTSIAIGSTTALSVTAAGTATLTYQWYYNGTAITGATTSSYSKTWGAGDGGVYKVVVTNSAGSDSSKTTVTINSSITTPLPGTTNVVQGSSTALTIVASGTPPITYQWYYNGAAITGATTASYSKTWGGADGGVYKVVVTNPTGKDSSTTQLTVTSTAPTGASADPAAICSGGSSSLSVTGGSLGTDASWKWYTDAACTTPVLGNNTGTPITVSPTSTTTYYVRAEGAGNNTATAGVMVTVNTPSTAANGAVATPSTVCSGTSSSLSVSGGTLGTGASWKWYTDAGFTTPVTGINTGTPITVTPSTTTTYYVRAEGACGNTTGSSAVVTVNTNSVAPTSIGATVTTICSGSTSTLTESGGTLGTAASYHWYTDAGCTIPVTGTNTGASITVSPTSTTIYYVRAEGTCGNTATATTTITVSVPSIAPTGATAGSAKINAGNSTTVSVSGGSLGTGASWKWYTNSGCTNAAGAGTSITVTPAATTTYYVRAESSTPCGNTSTASVTVTVISVTQISCCDMHTLFVKSDSTLWACGDDSYGELCDGGTTVQLTPIKVKTGIISAVAVNGGSSLYLTSTGDLYQVASGSTTKIMTNVQSMSASSTHILILKKDQTLWACGGNSSGELGDGTTISRTSPEEVYYSGVKAVAAGQGFSLVLMTNGTLYACGDNGSGELGYGTLYNGDSTLYPVTITGTFTSISAAYQQSFAIKSDGTVWSWGFNYAGQLGNADSSTTQNIVPAQMLSVANVASVSAGQTQTLMLTTGGVLWATGFDLNGQLCDGQTATRRAPENVMSGVQYIAADAGNGSSFVVKTDGTVWVCGANGNGQLGNGTYTTQPNLVKISGASTGF